MILNKMTFSRIKLLFESSCFKFLLKLWVVVYLSLLKILFICDCLSFEIRFYGRCHSCFCNQGSAAARQPCVSLSKIVILLLQKFRWRSEACSYTVNPSFFQKDFFCTQAGLNVRLMRGCRALFVTIFAILRYKCVSKFKNM